MPEEDYHPNYFVFSADPQGGLAISHSGSTPQLYSITPEGDVLSLNEEQELNHRNVILGPIDPYMAYSSTRHTSDQILLRYGMFDPENQTMITPVEGNVAYTGMRDAVDYGSLTVHGDRVIATWSDVRYPDNDALPMIQMLDLDSGTPLLESNGTSILPGLIADTLSLDVTRVHTTTDRNGELFFAVHVRYDDPFARGLILQKLSLEGEPLWGDEGVRINSPDDNDFHIHSEVITPDQAGGAFTIFKYHAYDLGLYSLGLAHLDSDGDPILGEDGNNFISLPIESDHMSLYDMCLLELDETLFMLYSDLEVESTYVARCSVEGENTQIETLTPWMWRSRMVPLDDRVLFIWHDLDHDIYGQILDCQGNRLWGDGHRMLAPAEDVGEMEVVLAGADSSSFWISWTEDYQDTYAQRFDINGDAVFEIPVYSSEMPHWIMVGQEDGGIYAAINSEPYEVNSFIEVFRLGPMGEYDDNVISIPTGRYPEFYGLASDGGGGAILFWKQNGLLAQRFSLPEVGVAGGGSVETPQEFALEPIYPNPFNGTATISLTLPSPGDLNVALFNVLGQEVMTVVRGPRVAGTHQISVDASALASGVYFVRAEMADSDLSATQKIVLMK